MTRSRFWGVVSFVTIFSAVYLAFNGGTLLKDTLFIFLFALHGTAQHQWGKWAVVEKFTRNAFGDRDSDTLTNIVRRLYHRAKGVVPPEGWTAVDGEAEIHSGDLDDPTIRKVGKRRNDDG